jgi:hypothetical protein
MGTADPDVDEIRGLLRLRRAVPITVEGGCMAPTLRHGQTVLVRRPDEPRPGDVALLDAGGAPEIHRLLDRVRVGRRTWYVHAGDASVACGVAGEADILGVVAVSRPRAAPVRARLLGLALRARALLSILTR